MKHMAREALERYPKISRVMQDYCKFKILILAYHVSSEILSLHIPGYASLPNLSQVILGYPISENLYWDILGYPDLPSRSFFQMTEKQRERQRQGQGQSYKQLPTGF